MPTLYIVLDAIRGHSLLCIYMYIYILIKGGHVISRGTSHQTTGLNHELTLTFVKTKGMDRCGSVAS
jgi:hypothetical protein